jgi:hypothetical protein
MMRGLLMLFLLLTGIGGGTGDGTPWTPVRVVGLSYPRLALQSQKSGVVHLRVRVTSSDGPPATSTISGDPLLAAAAAENLTAWRFAQLTADPRQKSTPRGNAFEMIYNFKLHAKGQDTFQYDYPNVVTISGTAPHWVP